MPYTQVSASLTDEDRQRIKQAIETIESSLPFLIHLSPVERQSLNIMGNSSTAFVFNSLHAAQSHPEILPAAFDLEEFARDYQLLTDLRDIHSQLQQLDEKIDDTLIAVSSEVMSSSLIVYRYIKTAANHIPGLKSIAELLGRRFRTLRPKPTEETPPSA